MAAAATRQLEFAAALAHKQICLLASSRAHPRARRPAGAPPVSQVAAHAQLKGRKAHLGVIYDQVARRSWAEKAAAGVAGFQVCLFAPSRAPASRRAPPFRR